MTMTPLVYQMTMPGAILDLAILGYIFLFASGSSITAQAHCTSYEECTAWLSFLTSQLLRRPTRIRYFTYVFLT
jgi:hypothetical protein